MELFRLLGTIAVDNSEANFAIDDTTERAEQSHSRIGSAFGKIGSAAVKAGKVMATGLAAGSAAVVAIGKKALDGYADFEQLVGGIETMFEDLSYDVEQNANKAFKTAGLSVNEYMETVMGFSAALTSSLQKSEGDISRSAELSDQIIIDMADNANKMGSTMESIQNAYSGFAKQNYTMLDNLKLGYGGTKEEMQRLLDDANKINAAQGKMTDYSIDNFADIAEAIHVVQEEMGIAGTTAKEASSTISGSIASMKSAWQNLLIGLGNEDADLSGLIDNFVDSASTVMDNVMPRLEIILGGIADLIAKIVPKIAEKLPQLLQATLPSIIQGAIGLVNGLISALPSILSILIEQIPFIIQQIGTALVEAFPVLIETVQELLGQFIDFIASELFGVSDVSGDVFGFIGEAFSGFMTFCSTAWTTIGKPIWDMISFAVGSLADLFAKNMPAIQQFFQNAIAGIKDTWENHLKPAFEAIGAFLNDVVKPAFEFVWKEVIEPLIEGVFKKIGDFWTNILKPVFDGICDFLTGVFTGNWEKMKDAIVDILTILKDSVSTIFNALVEVVKAPINLVIGIINGLISGVVGGVNAVINALNKFQIDVPGWVTDLTGIETFGFNLKTLTAPQIPYLEEGGVLEKGQVGLLEGNGAEAVVPLDRNSAWISRVAADMREHGIGGDSEIMNKILEKLEELQELLAFNLPMLARMQVCLDTGALIGELAPGMDEALGELVQMNERGV